MFESEEEYHRMAAVEQTLWWYRCLHALVLTRLRAERATDGLILDAGCGTGGLMLRLRDAGLNVRGVDLSPLAVEHCRRRGLPAEQGSLAQLADHAPPDSLSAIVCNDVLYFLTPQERVAAFRSWRGLLRKGGKIILNVPTGNAFRGIHDVSVGIGERISFARLQSELHEAGYRILYRRYWPFLLSPLVLAARFWQRRKLRRGEAEIRSDIDVPAAQVNAGMYAITRTEMFLPIGWFGSSLFVVAEPRD